MVTDSAGVLSIFPYFGSSLDVMVFWASFESMGGTWEWWGKTRSRVTEAGSRKVRDTVTDETEAPGADVQLAYSDSKPSAMAQFPVSDRCAVLMGLFPFNIVFLLGGILRVKRLPVPT